MARALRRPYRALGAVLALFTFFNLLVEPQFAWAAASLPQLTINIQGVPVNIPVTMDANKPTDGSGVKVTAHFALSDLQAKIDAIFRAAGIEGIGDGNFDFSYRGTLMDVRDGKLWVKVHFEINPPIFPRSKGSGEFLFRGQVDNDQARLALDWFDLNISNSVTKGAIDFFGLSQNVKKLVTDVVTSALEKPDFALPLPAPAAAFGVKLQASAFEKTKDGLFAVIVGTLPPAANALFP